MRLEDMKKDIPETPEFIHTMIQSEVKKQLQDTKVVNIQTRRVKKWTGARVAAAIAVCVLATSTIVYAGTKLYHMFLEKQGAYSIVTGIKADGSTGKINLPERIHDIDISAGYIPERCKAAVPHARQGRKTILPVSCVAGFRRGRCTLRCAAPVYRNFERHIAFEILCD